MKKNPLATTNAIFLLFILRFREQILMGALLAERFSSDCCSTITKLGKLPRGIRCEAGLVHARLCGYVSD
jgi:hypothetical protein